VKNHGKALTNIHLKEIEELESIAIYPSSVMVSDEVRYKEILKLNATVYDVGTYCALPEAARWWLTSATAVSHSYRVRRDDKRL
jgi:hypothetical protein